MSNFDFAKYAWPKVVESIFPLKWIHRTEFLTHFARLPMGSQLGSYCLYCDQPFISETTRCESDDFIQTIDAHEKMLCAFMCEG